MVYPNSKIFWTGQVLHPPLRPKILGFSRLFFLQNCIEMNRQPVIKSFQMVGISGWGLGLSEYWGCTSLTC
ncbi:hypothetical protein O77CONTIG1_01807 [Leptolyngbya sp. O-77]|nr:hypothetical protein O77CONTIG1_01807 [Leptolyngbya sp. O-77]